VSLTAYCSLSLALRALGQNYSAWSSVNYKWVGLSIFLALFGLDRFRRSTKAVVSLAMFWSVAFNLCTSGQSYSAGSPLKEVWVFLALFLGLLGTGLGISYVTARRFNHTFLDNTPLATSIKTILSTRALRTRVYATCALEWHAWDPDNPTFSAVIVGFDGTPIPGSPFFGDRQRMWLPLYLPVHDLPMEDQVKTLLASAALPFGVVPGIEWNGWRLVDGGVADNVPLYPVSNADEVFVVLLAPTRNRNMAELGLTAKRWTIIDRLRRVFLYPRPSFYMPWRPELKAPKVIPDRAPEKFPTIRVFAPKRSLGGFLTGTLNFNGKYARRRMREGYLDTMKSLRDMGIASPSKG
jgi:hypothetical protein